MMVLAKNGHFNGNDNSNHKFAFLERVAIALTDRIGTPISLIIHTLLFIGIFSLRFFGVTTDYILLMLTTAVSLEAIYLSIFIQMTVNRATESLEEVEEDIEDIQEESSEDEEAHKVILHMSKELKVIQKDLETLKKKGLI